MAENGVEMAPDQVRAEVDDALGKIQRNVAARLGVVLTKDEILLALIVNPERLKG
jgi:hypothetical protein